MIQPFRNRKRHIITHLAALKCAFVQETLPVSTFQTNPGLAIDPQWRHKVLGIVSRRAATSEKETMSYRDWANIVQLIRSSQSDGMEELYQCFSSGMRFYLCRQTGPQDLEDRLHDLFIVIVQAIRRGDIREPERLMGFVRTVAKRQVSAYIRHVVSARKEDSDIQSERDILAVGGGPEQAAIFHQRQGLIDMVLAELSDLDREVLIRFYLKEQDANQICLEMELTETQFRLLKSRAKARFGTLGKKALRKNSMGPAF
jgi:RNA polymerase sigma-70 factor, ECF subfamily